MHTPNTANAGVTNWAKRRPVAWSMTALPTMALSTTRKLSGNTSVKKAATGWRQKPWLAYRNWVNSRAGMVGRRCGPVVSARGVTVCVIVARRRSDPDTRPPDSVGPK